MEIIINKKLILDFMTKHNLSKTGFCKFCNIAPSTLHILFTAPRRLTLRPIYKIARAMNVELAEMFSNENSEE
ncbi:MAG: helix-turn-helix domain-containing protein [Clostridia bacterium]|nr:helix-turn-helix domain-containing protein [Clostridia bacterium]MBQ8792475.1 helix-turn-helix domain-containing protein [Clostridia bacterium]